MEIIGSKPLNFDDTLIQRRSLPRNQRKISKRLVEASGGQVLLDDNLLELTKGKPFPLKHRAKAYFNKAVTNDTLFLKMLEVMDYSILVGFDEDSHEIVVGIIDYLRKVSYIYLYDHQIN